MKTNKYYLMKKVFMASWPISIPVLCLINPEYMKGLEVSELLGQPCSGVNFVPNALRTEELSPLKMRTPNLLLLKSEWLLVWNVLNGYGPKMKKRN